MFHRHPKDMAAGFKDKVTRDPISGLFPQGTFQYKTYGGGKKTIYTALRRCKGKTYRHNKQERESARRRRQIERRVGKVKYV